MLGQRMRSGWGLVEVIALTKSVDPAHGVQALLKVVKPRFVPLNEPV
jgi:hypothetical protein